MFRFRHPNRRGIQGPRPKNSGSGFVGGGLPLAEPVVPPPPVVQEAEELDFSRVWGVIAHTNGKLEIRYREQ